MLDAFLRIVGLLTAIGGAFNLVGVVRSISYDPSEFAALTELASSLGLLISWMVIVSGLTLFGVGEILARQPKPNPARIYAQS